MEAGSSGKNGCSEEEDSEQKEDQEKGRTEKKEAMAKSLSAEKGCDEGRESGKGMMPGQWGRNTGE